MNIPKWVQYILGLIIGMAGVFASSYGGLRAFEGQLLTKYEALEIRVVNMEKEYSTLKLEMNMADQHTLDVVEMNRQVRQEQFNAINTKLEEIKKQYDQINDRWGEIMHILQEMNQ